MNSLPVTTMLASYQLLPVNKTSLLYTDYSFSIRETDHSLQVLKCTAHFSRHWFVQFV